MAMARGCFKASRRYIHTKPALSSLSQKHIEEQTFFVEDARPLVAIFYRLTHRVLCCTCTCTAPTAHPQEIKKTRPLGRDCQQVHIKMLDVYYDLHFAYGAFESTSISLLAGDSRNTWAIVAGSAIIVFCFYQCGWFSIHKVII